MKQGIVVFGEQRTTVSSLNVPDRLSVLGFISSDKSLIFESMEVLLVEPDSFLYRLVPYLIENDSDMVLFCERDYIIRAFTVDENQFLVYLCSIDKPVLKQTPTTRLEYPDFALVM